MSRFHFEDECVLLLVDAIDNLNLTTPLNPISQTAKGILANLAQLLPSYSRVTGRDAVQTEVVERCDPRRGDFLHGQAKNQSFQKFDRGGAQGILGGIGGIARHAEELVNNRVDQLHKGDYYSGCRFIISRVNVRGDGLRGGGVSEVKKCFHEKDKGSPLVTA